jgi:hypothetical protein
MDRASLLTEKRNDSTIPENGNIWLAKVSSRNDRLEECPARALASIHCDGASRASSSANLLSDNHLVSDFVRA